MIRRRRFLLGGLGIVVLAGVGLVGGGYVTESEIASAVRRRLSSLKLDDAGLHAFAKDQIGTLLAKRPTWNRLKSRLRAALAKPMAAQYGGTNDRRSKRERIEDNLATVFLLSSDFFVKGADESRTVQYVALYDPMRACGNPFARPPPGIQAAS
jgi:hypothetical protein